MVIKKPDFSRLIPLEVFIYYLFFKRKITKFLFNIVPNLKVYYFKKNNMLKIRLKNLLNASLSLQVKCPKRLFFQNLSQFSEQKPPQKSKGFL